MADLCVLIICTLTGYLAFKGLGNLNKFALTQSQHLNSLFILDLPLVSCTLPSTILGWNYYGEHVSVSLWGSFIGSVYVFVLIVLLGGFIELNGLDYRRYRQCWWLCQTVPLGLVMIVIAETKSSKYWNHTARVVFAFYKFLSVQFKYILYKV